jgi:transcriptional regulator with XRE-family HTH domain
LARDRTLQVLIADLVAARIAAGMTQQEVARKMWTTKSAICRLESGVCTPPNLSTIEKYANAVGARVEVRVRTGRKRLPLLGTKCLAVSVLPLSATTSRSASSSNADAHLQRLERRYAAGLWFWAWGVIWAPRHSPTR